MQESLLGVFVVLAPTLRATVILARILPRRPANPLRQFLERAQLREDAGAEGAGLDDLWVSLRLREEGVESLSLRLTPGFAAIIYF